MIENQQEYGDAPKPTTIKNQIAYRIVKCIRSLDPPGRFLKKDKDSGLWIEIGDEKAREKAKERLKEKRSPKREKTYRQQCDRHGNENASQMVPNQSNGSDGHPNDDPQVGPENTDSLCRQRSHTANVLTMALPVDEVVNDLKSLAWQGSLTGPLMSGHMKPVNALQPYVWNNKQYMASASDDCTIKNCGI